MSSSSRMRNARSAVVALAAGALVLTACSSGGGGETTGETGGGEAQAEQASIAFGTAEDSMGPAEEVPGATKGGTIRVLQRDSFAHLDPAQIYVSDEGLLASLFSRQLVTYKVDMDGTTTLVGDLAKDIGEEADGGKTWKYTLKDGIKFEDGSPITSKDVRHSIERSYATFITEGPKFVQQWLSGSGEEYRKALPDGPYKGKHLPDSVLETPDDKTVIFHFKDPQPDLPYALAMAGYGIVPEAKDTKEKYDLDPVASGPYKISEFKTGKSMTLVKNEHWDPKTDPARHQYVDKFAITFNHEASDSTKRLMSDAGENQTALSFTNAVDPASIPQVVGDAEMKKRTVSGYQPYVGQMNFNMNRIKDKKVREALAYAMPVKSIVQALGGSYGAEVAGGLISPTLAGYQEDYDPFGKKKKPEGDPEKAKALLEEAGKVGMKITFAYINTEAGQEYSVAVADALEKAGFDVQRKELPADTYYDVVGKVDNGFDVYNSAWGADWPSASTVIPPLYYGPNISDGGNNYSHIDDPKVNSEVERILKITDPAEAADEWFELNKYIVEEVTPVVPTVYYKQMQIYGSKIGGVMYNDQLSYIDPTKLYIKK